MSIKNRDCEKENVVMLIRSLMRNACVWSLQVKTFARVAILAMLVAVLTIAGQCYASTFPYSNYIPTAIPSATSTLYSATTAMSPGRVGVDKAGNVYFIGHASGATSTLYEIPASSPVVAVSAPTTLITGLGQYNANSAFVDGAGNLWVSNGNGGGIIEIPASNGVPNLTSLQGGVALSSITESCTSSSTAPCILSAAHILSALSYIQVVDIYSDGDGNLVLVDYYDTVSSGGYNRILKLNTASLGNATVLADSLTSSTSAQVTIAGDSNVYYCSGGSVSLVSSGALTTINNLAASSLTLLNTAVEVSTATGVTTDPWGNLIISGAKQISEIPLEGGSLATADQFNLLLAASGGNAPTSSYTITYGGTFDVHGNYYYAYSTTGASRIMQTQINGYNFGKVNVGTEVTTAAPYLNITWSLPSWLTTSVVTPAGSPSALSSANAAYLQSFPYGGSKNYYGGTAYSASTSGQYSLMYFQPIHAGLLKGAISPMGFASAKDSLTYLNGAYLANLQGVGVGPTAMFIPGTASKAVTLSQLYTSVSHATKASGFTPTSVAIDTYGDIFMTDSANGKLDIYCLPTTSNTAQYYGTTSGTDPSSVAYSGSYYASYCQANGTGYTFAVSGSSFVTPTDIALDGSNSVYVLDSSSSSAVVTKFSFSAMTPITVVPSGSTVAGTAFSDPQGLTVDGYGNLYIADTGNNRIIQGRMYNAQYSQNIVYVSSATTFGGTTLSSPAGIGVDSVGNLYIADTGNKRIVEYSVTGVTSVVSTSGVSLTNPTSVKVLPSGALIVADSNLGLILVNSGVATELSTGSITLSGTGGLGLDLAGNIYVADPVGDQVVELNVNSPAVGTPFPDTYRTNTSSQTVSTIYNSGNAALAIASSPTVTDNTSTSSDEFAVDSGNSCVSGASIASTSYCSLVMDFTPLSTATLYSTVTGTASLVDSMPTISLASNTAYTAQEIGSISSATSTQTVTVSGEPTVPMTAQTITFTQPTAVTWSASIPSIQLVATGGGSGNPVTFSIVSGTGTLSGTNNSVLTVTDIGSTVIAANQAGGYNSSNDTYYSAAEQVTQTMVVNPIGTVATPTFSVAGGVYTSAQSVTISDATAGATIYYTTNGNTPTIASTVYTGTAITVGLTTTIKAIAVETGYTTSGVASATYTLYPDFTVSSAVSTFNIVNGLDGSGTVTVTPLFGFTSSVTLSCSGLSGSNTCSLSPTTVTPSGSAAYSTLYVQTNETASSLRRRANLFAPTTALAALVFCFSLKKRKQLLLVILLALGVAGFSTLTACSSASPKSDTSTFTLTATSGSIVHTQTITLNVSNIHK